MVGMAVCWQTCIVHIMFYTSIYKAVFLDDWEKSGKNMTS